MDGSNGETGESGEPGDFVSSSLSWYLWYDDDVRRDEHLWIVCTSLKSRCNNNSDESENFSFFK